MLMAEIEHREHGDSGRARAWTLRAVRALHDPVWTADGYVSDHWRPVSPVTGRVDAFQWQTPLAALPSSRPPLVEAEVSDQIAGDTPRVEALPAAEDSKAQDVAIPPVDVEAASSGIIPMPDETATSLTHHTQSEEDKAGAVPGVIPIVRAPDDPGVDDSSQNDGFVEEDPAAARQAGGLRGLLSRRGS
jgi:HemY protein